MTVEILLIEYNRRTGAIKKKLFEYGVTELEMQGKTLVELGEMHKLKEMELIEKHTSLKVMKKEQQRKKQAEVKEQLKILKEKDDEIKSLEKQLNELEAREQMKILDKVKPEPKTLNDSSKEVELDNSLPCEIVVGVDSWGSKYVTRKIGKCF